MIRKPTCCSGPREILIPIRRPRPARRQSLHERHPGFEPDSGKLKWFYQVTPHDTPDWDANAPLLLVDTKYRRRDRKLLLRADKNGFFYVLDRTDGHVVLASKFVQRELGQRHRR